MSTEDKIAVMQAFEDGKDLEVANKGEERWVSTVMPIWNWVAYNYRIKPAPASQLDRIKAEYAEYRVAMLGWCKDTDALRIDNGVVDYPHIFAQSIRGFYSYVYEKKDGRIFKYHDPIFAHNSGVMLHPCAVLFTK